MQPIISIKDLTKFYATGFEALKPTNLEIRRGEIFGLLGPNGAGKTTLINIVCGIVNPTGGTITVNGHDIRKHARAARDLIGLVPQELSTDAFETVWATTKFSRGLFGKPKNAEYCEKVLRSLSLWDKKDSKIMTLSGGMKRRVMIAKALAHEPQILFLDEPTAGVDVQLRQDMWNVVRGLQASGVTIILTTHYIEEAEEMADRIGVINHGEIILVEEKAELMRKLGKKQMTRAAPRAAHGAAGISGALPARAARRWPRARLYLRHAQRTHGNHDAARRARRRRHSLQGSLDDAELARGDLRESRAEIGMNWHAVHAIYHFEMARMFRTIVQSIVAPVLSTSLYFVVFGSAIGSRIQEVDGTSYGAFIVPGLIMLSLLTESIGNASFGIYFPRFTGTIYEVLSAPVSAAEVILGYVGAAATKSVILGFIILATAALFVPIEIRHPFWMLAFLVLTAATFSLFGFIIGLWADSFEKLQVVPLLVITPLTFLGGSFYSISMLPPVWQTITLFNPIVYLVSGFRWSFYEIADVRVGISLGMTLAFMLACLATTWWMLTTGWRLKK